MPSAAVAKMRELRTAAPETKRTAGSVQEFRSRIAPRLNATAAVKPAPNRMARGCKPPIVAAEKFGAGQRRPAPMRNLRLAGGVFDLQVIGDGSEAQSGCVGTDAGDVLLHLRADRTG